MKCELVNFWLDHQKFGCGFRDFAALRGRKHVRLVMIATGESASISIEDYLRAKRSERNWAQPRPIFAVARRLRRNAKKSGTIDTAAVKRVLRELRQ